MQPLRIVVTTPFPAWPVSAGGSRRTLSLARALAACGHRVTLLSKGAPPPETARGEIAVAAGYASRGRIAHFVNPAFGRALNRVLAGGQDLVIAGGPFQAGALVRACARHGVPLVYDAHNVEAERFASTGHRLIARIVRMREAMMIRHARAVLAVSEPDRTAFHELYGCSPLLLPNGVDPDVFTPGPPDPALAAELGLAGKAAVLFFGSFDYAPNVEGLEALLTMPWPMRADGGKEARLLVVGRAVPAWARAAEGVTVAGEVEDVVPYIRLADLVVAPLASGGGTRLKIIEALACGQRVLSTRFGATGLSASGIPGLHLCSLEAFRQELEHRLAGPFEPGHNDGGRQWALTMSWQRLVADIDWHALAAS